VVEVEEPLEAEEVEQVVLENLIILVLQDLIQQVL
jgi:hypothetical protein